MCGLHTYNKHKDNSTDAKNFCGVRPLPDYYTIYSCVSLCVSLNIIDTWLKASANNIVLCLCTYKKNTKELFGIIPTEIPIPTLGDFKRKRQLLLTYIGGEWHINKISSPKPPSKNPWLSKKNKKNKTK